MRPLDCVTMGLAALIAATAAPAAQAGERKAPDLTLEWVAGRAGAEPTVLRGHAGETLGIAYRLRNVGDGDAFACILEATEDGGTVLVRERLQPGPRARSVQRRELTVTLASGISKICLEARLQTVRREDADDPDPEGNRICRRVEVVDDRGAVAERSASVHALALYSSGGARDQAEQGEGRPRGEGSWGVTSADRPGLGNDPPIPGR